MDLDLPVLTKWIQQREKTIEGIRELATKLDTNHTRAKKGAVAGKSVVVGGTAIVLGSLAAAPFTGGLSLAVGVAGAIGTATGVLGTATSVGAKWVESRHANTILDEIQLLLDEDRKASDDINGVLDLFKQIEQNFTNFLETEVKQGLINVPDEPPSIQTIRLDKPAKCHDTSNKTPTTNITSRMSATNISATAIKMTSYANMGLRLARQLNLFNVNRILNFGKNIVKGVPVLPAIGMTKAPGMVLRVGRRVAPRVAHGGGAIVSIVLLPVEIYSLVKSIKELKGGNSHEKTSALVKITDDLTSRLQQVKNYFRDVVHELNNLILLFRAMKKQGCSEGIEVLMNNVLKTILPGRKLLKAFERVDLQADEPCSNEKIKCDTFSGILINCDEILKESIYKELATVIWSAWKMGDQSVIFLQNTALTADPALWTLFGVSVNSFGTDTERGVSVLFPTDFPGNIVSDHEFRHTSADWNGRCVIVNIELLGQRYACVNVLAPDHVTDRDLFLKTIGKFVKDKADGKIILAANFCTEIKSISVLVRNKVSQTTPLSLIQKCIPYMDVCEYLAERPGFTDIPDRLVKQVCHDYVLEGSNSVKINWYHCGSRHGKQALVTTEDNSKQVRPIVKLGVGGLWKQKNKGLLEFSSETEVSERVIHAYQNLDFFVTDDLVESVSECAIIHTLRFLGFLKQSVMVFKIGDKGCR